MRMREIIPTGMQGKAIYGEGNYIIDGAAGTGKSTTVLQKIKLLQKQDNISTKKILVLVKNKNIIDEFNDLLSNNLQINVFARFYIKIYFFTSRKN